MHKKPNKSRYISSLVLSVSLVIIAIVLTGCSAAHTMIKKRNLDVQTKMSETIFLEPTKPADKVIYVSIKNTSDKSLDIKNTIKSVLTENGFTITQDPDAAKFMLQGNILQVGKSDLRTARDALASGWGGVMAGAAIAGATGGSGRNMMGSGLLMGALALAGDALVDDTFFSMVTDLQIRERPRAGEVITQSQHTSASQGSATTMTQNVSGGQMNWKTYRTRIVSTANKANLKFEEALPVLESGLVRSISGLFSD